MGCHPFLSLRFYLLGFLASECVCMFSEWVWVSIKFPLLHQSYYYPFEERNHPFCNLDIFVSPLNSHCIRSPSRLQSLQILNAKRLVKKHPSNWWSWSWSHDRYSSSSTLLSFIVFFQHLDHYFIRCRLLAWKIDWDLLSWGVWKFSCLAPVGPWTMQLSIYHCYWEHKKLRPCELPGF